MKSTKSIRSVPSTLVILSALSPFAYLWSDESGQDIAEYAVMLAVILVIVVGTIKIIGEKSNNIFSQVGSSLGGQ